MTYRNTLQQANAKAMGTRATFNTTSATRSRNSSMSSSLNDYDPTMGGPAESTRIQQPQHSPSSNHSQRSVTRRSTRNRKKTAPPSNYANVTMTPTKGNRTFDQSATPNQGNSLPPSALSTPHSTQGSAGSRRSLRNQASPIPSSVPSSQQPHSTQGSASSRRSLRSQASPIPSSASSSQQSLSTQGSASSRGNSQATLVQSTPQMHSTQGSTNSRRMKSTQSTPHSLAGAYQHSSSESPQPHSSHSTPRLPSTNSSHESGHDSSNVLTRMKRTGGLVEHDDLVPKRMNWARRPGLKRLKATSKLIRGSPSLSTHSESDEEVEEFGKETSSSKIEPFTHNLDSDIDSSQDDKILDGWDSDATVLSSSIQESMQLC